MSLPISERQKDEVRATPASKMNYESIDLFQLMDVPEGTLNLLKAQFV